jgi:hypothetical protein
MKVRLIKIFVTAMHLESRFDYLRQKFPRIREAKMKEGIFVGPQVEQRFQDLSFKNKLNAADRRACVGFENVCSNILGNKKSENYVEIVEELLFSSRAFGCSMSLKLQFL